MASAGKDKIAAGVLAILVGGLGIHKFYLGDIGLGVLYFLFAWTGIPAIIGLVEGIIYLTTSDEEWARKYPPTESTPPSSPTPPTALPPAV